MNIYKELIKKNINKLTPYHLEDFAKKKKITYNQAELNTIYEFIMNNYNNLLNEEVQVFEKIRNKINPELYKRILNLYIEYKQKYF